MFAPAPARSTMSSIAFFIIRPSTAPILDTDLLCGQIIVTVRETTSHTAVCHIPRIVVFALLLPNTLPSNSVWKAGALIVSVCMCMCLRARVAISTPIPKMCIP